jgi:hypothetical protein
MPTLAVPVIENSLFASSGPATAASMTCSQVVLATGIVAVLPDFQQV